MTKPSSQNRSGYNADNERCGNIEISAPVAQIAATTAISVAKQAEKRARSLIIFTRRAISESSQLLELLADYIARRDLN